MDHKIIENAYGIAKDRYAEFEVNPDEIIKRLKEIPISVHCWQGDDVTGFENPDQGLSDGGIQVTGNYPGRARNFAELTSDYEKVFSLVPGSHRVNLHAIYGDFAEKKRDRNELVPEQFDKWINWARKLGVKLDFNPTLFSHPKASSGFTLSSINPEIRKFWVEHINCCREIASYMGKKQGSPCICNLWIPDGSKDITVSRFKYRELLKSSLDEIYEKTYSDSNLKDAVEGKLFGIGSEYFVVGSHDFYLSYTSQNDNVMLCMDMGHYHPTEDVGDKISSVLQFQDELLLHVSRGVRWDSDHVVIMNDHLMSVAHEIIRSEAISKSYIALDFFDASINRLGAWITGIRSTQKALLRAMLEPTKILRDYEENGELFQRLSLFQEMKNMPWTAIWDYFCLKNDVPVAYEWIEEVEKYEGEILKNR
mgnify:FL=1